MIERPEDLKSKSRCYSVENLGCKRKRLGCLECKFEEPTGGRGYNDIEKVLCGRM